MVTLTWRLLALIWADARAREDTLMGFFAEVQQGGASREQIDRWLLTMLDAAPGQRELLLLRGIDLDAVVWSEATEFLCSCFYAMRRRAAFPDLPPSGEWRNMVAPYPHRERPIKYTVPLQVLPLEERLLALGGKRMVYVGGDADLPQLLSRGRVFEEPAKFVRGEPSRCHTNAARLWLEDPSVFSIVTGYALSEDGLWRQHSWLMRNSPMGRQRRLVETTVRRVKYFGFVLNAQEAEEFVSMVGL